MEVNGKSGVWPTWDWETFISIDTDRLRATVKLKWAILTVVTLKLPIKGQPRSEIIAYSDLGIKCPYVCPKLDLTVGLYFSI